MKNLKLVETIQEIDYDRVRVEMLRIQAEIVDDVANQKKKFIRGSLRPILYSLCVYVAIIAIAWTKYRK